MNCRRPWCPRHSASTRLSIRAYTGERNGHIASTRTVGSRTASRDERRGGVVRAWVRKPRLVAQSGGADPGEQPCIGSRMGCARVRARLVVHDERAERRSFRRKRLPRLGVHRTRGTYRAVLKRRSRNTFPPPRQRNNDCRGFFSAFSRGSVARQAPRPFDCVRRAPGTQQADEPSPSLRSRRVRARSSCWEVRVQASALHPSAAR